MKKIPSTPHADEGLAHGAGAVSTEFRRQEAVLKTGALQNAILNSANFSSIATDAEGVIQIFNVGAERMLGYAAADVVNKITPAEISDPQEVITRAEALSTELGTLITPGFEALVFKASRGIEDIYELTYIRKDGSRFPAIVSVTALRDPPGAIIGYLLIGTDNTARKESEAAQKKLDQRLHDEEVKTRSLIESNADAQKALRTSELRYRRLFEAAREGILILEVDTGRIIDVNPFLTELLDFSHGEMIGKTVGELSPFKDIASNQAMLEQLQQDGYVRYEDLPLETRDGRKIAVEFVSNVYQAGDKKVIHCNIRDITERKQTENALRTSEAEFRSLAESMPQMVWVTRPDGWNTYFSQQWMDYTGLTLAESLGHGWNKPFHPDDQQPAWDAWQHATATISTYSVECRLRRADGVYRWWLIRGVPFCASDGSILKWFGTCTDIQDLKQTELGLARLAAIVESSDEAIISKDLNSIITSWNSGAEKLYGYTSGDMVGTSILRLIPADQQDEENQILGNIKRGKSVERFETLRQARDGRLIDVLITVSPIKDAAGNVTGVSKVVHDITDRKIMEGKIHQLNVELERRVVERTAQLQTANDELEAFSYSVSHDLRAPLRAIDGFSQAVVEDFGSQLPAEGQRQLETIRYSAQRMGALIDDLLTFARLNRHGLSKRAIDTDKLVRDALQELGAPWPDRKVEVRIAVLPASSGDPALLKQVWLNLLSNALKYTRKQPDARVEVGCTKTDGVDTFFIRDNGTGFDMRYADKLFGVFQRFHRVEDYEGTGVGLAIVQRIVQRHGGRVWADAAVGRGATFYFTLEKEPKP